MRSFSFTMLVLLSIFFLPACQKAGGGGLSSGQASFFLTDAPSDSLSSLQIQLDSLSIKNTAGGITAIFPAPGGKSETVNLLALRGVSKLLAASTLPPGIYREISMGYSKAQAVDNNGNALTVTPNTGTVKILFNPPLNIGGAGDDDDNDGKTGFDDAFGHREFDVEHKPELAEGNHVGIKLDFNVNLSVESIVPGVGGSLVLRPTIIVRTQQTGDHEMNEFKGTIVGVTASGLLLKVGPGQMTVNIKAGAILETLGNQTTYTTGFNLGTLFKFGKVVEVKGKLDAKNNVINATKIEAEDGVSGVAGLSLSGVIKAIQANSFDVIVLQSGNSGVLAGSVQRIAYSPSARFSYANGTVASAGKLALGQGVRVVGTSSALQPQIVKLRGTRLQGKVLSVTTNSASLTVASVEGVNVTQIAGFSNPVTAQFTTALPNTVVVNGQVTLKGYFNLKASGKFDVVPAPATTTPVYQTFTGTTFSVVSATALSITGNGSALGKPNPTTMTANFSTTTMIVERNKTTFTIITLSPADLVKAINAGRYKNILVEGQYNGVTNTMNSVLIRVDLP